MLEHLDKQEAIEFLVEVRRVLKRQGILRLAVPDLRRMIVDYETDADADRLVTRTQLAHTRPKTALQKLRWLFVTDRSHHRWMYDANSLTLLVEKAGFSRVVVQPAGATMIPNPGQLNLREREEESLYVEAERVGVNWTAQLVGKTPIRVLPENWLPDSAAAIVAGLIILIIAANGLAQQLCYQSQWMSDSVAHRENYIPGTTENPLSRTN
jgi:hypothetical protein